MLTGGIGADTFHFEVLSSTGGGLSYETGWGHDVITDFELGTDHLDIQGENGAVTVTDTAGGTLVSVVTFGPFGGQSLTTILLQNLHGVTDIGDLIA